MRKADYVILAQVIKAHRTRAQRGLSVTPDSAIGRAIVALTEQLARELSQRLNVDPAAFIKACGID